MTTFPPPAPPSTVPPASGLWPGTSPFEPRRWLGNGHVMTVFAWAAKRLFDGLPPVDMRLVRVSDDTQVRIDCFWQPEPAGRPTLVALHGLEGSSTVHYMRGLASKAFAAGWNTVLLNQRNCGGTEHLTPGLYHSGLTDDPRAVIRSLAASDGLSDFAVVGYSLGGNLTAKLAAEMSDHPDLPVRAAVAVCPTMDLDLCVRALERRSNAVYHLNFVRNLRARMRRKAAAWPGLYDLTPLDSIWSIRKFDDVYTAPHHGFGDAANYYRLASAARIADRVPIPLLILAAEDDPFVPAGQFRADAIAGNPNIRVVVTNRGGHCAFVAPRSASHDGYWAEAEAMRFLQAFTPGGHPASAGSS
jgi:predicted alpha/beta-fold hydrolase